MAMAAGASNAVLFAALDEMAQLTKAIYAGEFFLLHMLFLQLCFCFVHMLICVSLQEFEEPCKKIKTVKDVPAGDAVVV